MILAWGACVSPEFRADVVGMCGRLRIPEPSWVMACIAFETGRTFSPDVRNAAGSGAVGLIQFMPDTASVLGTTTEALTTMSAEHQLVYVENYFRPWRFRLKTLGDVYAAILWPGMIGRDDGAIIFDNSDVHHPRLYLQNRGLDFNHDGVITRGEIVSRVQRELEVGLQPDNAITIT